MMAGCQDSYLLLLLIFAFITYFASLAFYRLLLHPLANFPGPRLAALTRYYEAYYDVVQNGQYTFKIAELHRKYRTMADLSVLDCTLTSTSRPNCQNKPL